MNFFANLTLIVLPLAAMGLAWLAVQLYRILPLVPRCNEDMVLTERPLGPVSAVAPVTPIHEAPHRPAQANELRASATA